MTSPATLLGAPHAAIGGEGGAGAAEQGQRTGGGEDASSRRHVTRGAKTAGAALKFTCPEGERLKTFGVTGHAGSLAAQSYEDHKTTNLMSFPPPHMQQASGTVYAVCR